MSEVLDCIVVGAGPAGLTAAIYLARFNLAIRVFDDGASRCAMIPMSHNLAGFPGGISGRELLARMGEQAAMYGATATPERVQAIARRGDGLFEATSGAGSVLTRTVLLATGVVNNRPPISEADHDAALARGLLRYCPICDGYEVADQAVGVIGTAEHGCNEAVFLRMYTRDVSLIAPEATHRLSDADRARLAQFDIGVVDGPCAPLRLEGDRIVVEAAGRRLALQSVYPALGSVIRSDLAVGLGARATEDGCLVIDAHQRTSVAGLYAAGDVVKGLDQISHAMGEAGVAAIAVRNALAQARPLKR